jgi:glycosyltransferase involved in cell wall biosynthesis
MRILYFSSRECWPVNSGARLRDYHLARQLAGHASVTYVGLAYPGADQYELAGEGLPPPEQVFEQVIRIPKARAYTPINLVRGLLGPTPVTVWNCTTPEIAAALSNLGQTTPGGKTAFDSIQMEGVHLVRYIPVLRAFPGHPPIVCDWHNIESELMWRYSENEASLPRRWYAKRTAGLIERSEAELLRGADAHTVVSEREAVKLRAAEPNAAIQVVENGVDTAYFSDCASDSGVPRNRIVFVASMDYHANVDAAVYFAREIWPAARERLRELTGAEFRFTIVGRSPTPEVVALQSLPGVEVTGTVPDVRPYYREAVAVVVPLRVGGGTRLKILEAMAAGVPVVSTTLGAEGLEVDPSRDLLIADTPVAITEAIASLADQPAQWRQLSGAGRAVVARTYEWKIVGERLFAIHQNAIHQKARQSVLAPA